MRIFYSKAADLFARRCIPGIAVMIFSAWGISSGGAVLQEVPVLDTKAVAMDTMEQEETAPAISNASYADGSYTGTAPGYGGDITMRVTIQEGKISAIDVVSASGETPAFFSKAKKLIGVMLEKQSAEVDVVSGATYSSKGIIQAVKNALIKASGGTVKETTGSSGLGASGGSGSGSGSAHADSFTDSTYTDGSYTGSAQGFGGKITVRVTISGGKIASVSIVSASGETASYLSRAKGVISKVIAKQSPNVDVVSGATYSSNGILNAIKKALNQAAAGNSSSSGADKDGEDIEASVAEPDRKYTDGVYLGTGYGYVDGMITARVTIYQQRIDSIDITEHEDQDASFFSRARGLITSILKKQTTKGVDTVSGATLSSNGILEAVNEALDKAAGVSKEEDPAEKPEEETKPEEKTDEIPEEKTDEPTDTTPQEEISTETFTYSSSGNCSPDEAEEFSPYSVTMTFTLKQTTKRKTDAEGHSTTTITRELTGVDIASPSQGEAGSNWTYLKKAVMGNAKVTGIAAKAIRNQSFSGIDTVSGATCSSRAVLQAAANMDLNLGTTVTEGE